MVMMLKALAVIFADSLANIGHVLV